MATASRPSTLTSTTHILSAPTLDPEKLIDEKDGTLNDTPLSSALTTASPAVLHLKGDLDDVTYHDQGDHDERISRSEGLTWGEKTDKANTWREKWITQVHDGRQFGRVHGETTSGSRVWEHEWSREGSVVKVLKKTTEFAAENEIEQRWFERITIDEEEGTVTETKFGIDNRDGGERRWQQTTVYALVHETTDLETVTKQVLRESHHEEKEGDITRSREIKYDDTGAVHHILTHRNLVTQEHWTDSWTDTASRKSGKRFGTNAQQEQWNEEWWETDQEREMKKWKISADGQNRWGTTTGRHRAGDGVLEDYNERWDRRQTYPEPGVLVEEVLTDRWRSRNETSSWGEKVKEINTFSVEAGQKILKNKVERNEVWYDNGTEKKQDRWTTTTTCDEDGQTIRMSKEGEVSGNRYSDNTLWGERWGEEKTAEDQLLVRHDEKWWIEPSGNKWGEKSYRDVSEGRRYNEKWYENPDGESQVDSWGSSSDGAQWGTKHGKKVDHGEGTVTWREEWGRKSDDEQWIQKSWNKCRDGQEHTAWGVNEGNQGKKRWFEKWLKNADEETNERFDDDGLGNFEVAKRGMKKRDGEVVDWFVDRYGECLGHGEKWAFKEGADQEQNRWTEKWTETARAKRAEKWGHNARGDQWKEEWNEEFNEEGVKVKTWAAKSGSNALGDNWEEEWTEMGRNKHARKFGASPSRNERWEESWGEQFDEDGENQKWCSKWAENAEGRWGKSWGDRWTKYESHKWGEEWADSQPVRKWSSHAAGPPE